MEGQGTLKNVKYTSVKKVEESKQKRRDQELPLSDVNLCSYILLTWLSPLIIKLFKQDGHDIADSDLWRCSKKEQCSSNTEKLTEIWNEEVARNGIEKASMLRCFTRFSRPRYLVSALWIVLNAGATFIVSGYLLNLIINYVESTDDNTGYALGLVVAMLVANVIRSVSSTALMVYAGQTGIQFRAGFLGLAYRKLLKMHKLEGKDLAKMITIFGGDAFRVYMNCLLMQYLLSLPVYTVIAVAYTYYLIGPSCFVAVGVFLMGYLMQGIIAKYDETARRKTVICTDKRVKKITEMINNIRFLKMHAWENAFCKSVDEIRHQEKKYLLLSAILSSLGSAIIPVTPTLASVASIVVYHYSSGQSLSAAAAFSVVGTLQFVRIILTLIPFAMRNFSETIVSFKRLQSLLNERESTSTINKCENKENAIEIKEGYFVWNAERTKEENEVETFLIKDLNLTITKGSLIGICGQVGSGKSSLLSVILGQMDKIKGTMAVNGAIGFVPQQYWMFNGTIKENILFGQPFTREKYEVIIRMCGLVEDLNDMNSADETEIGDRGINLSGGQKQRISLARAVYSDNDVYLLDDPLSSIDVNVGKHVFQECICNYLGSKTVLLVSNQPQHLLQCDFVYVLKNGQIIERGNPKCLAENGKYFSSLIEVSLKTNDNFSKKHQSNEKDKMHEDENQEESSEEINRPKGSITEIEELETGRVKWGTHRLYISAAGGSCICLSIFLLYSLASGSVLFSDWWLGLWIRDYHKEFLNATSRNTSSETALIKGEEPSAQIKSYTYLIVYASSVGIIILLTILRGTLGSLTMIRASVAIHKKVLRQVMFAPMTFFEWNPPGRILNRFSKDTDEVDVWLPQMIDSLFQILTLVTIALVSTVVVFPWALVGLFPVTVLFVILKNMSSASVRQFKRISNVVLSPLMSHVKTTVEGHQTITIFQQENKFIEKSNELIDRTSVATFLFDASTRWIGLRLDLISSLFIVLTTLVMVLTKGSSDAAISAVALTMCLKVVGNMQVMVRMLNEIEARITSVERLRHYLKHVKAETTLNEVQPDANWPRKGDITFQQVSLAYSTRSRVLEDINLKINEGEKVAIIGRTGAGKTSLTAALFRLVKVSTGKILINGLDIANVPLQKLRSRISIITQDTVLFSGTLRYNLDPLNQFEDSDIWQSLEYVYMKNKIANMSNGLNSLVEENGDISAGERQLICLARAILRKSKIIVLDEATASIDTHTDSLIQASIRERFSGCTVVTIAHRIETALQSDFIIVLDKGKIIERDTPENLLADPGSYLTRMIRSQVHKDNKADQGLDRL